MAGEGKKEEREKVEVRKGGRNGRGSREGWGGGLRREKVEKRKNG